MCSLWKFICDVILTALIVCIVVAFLYMFGIIKSIEFKKIKDTKLKEDPRGTATPFPNPTTPFAISTTSAEETTNTTSPLLVYRMPSYDPRLNGSGMGLYSHEDVPKKLEESSDWAGLPVRRQGSNEYSWMGMTEGDGRYKAPWNKTTTRLPMNDEVLFKMFMKSKPQSVADVTKRSSNLEDEHEMKRKTMPLFGHYLP